MSNDKSGRKNLVKKVLGIIILVIAAFLGVEIFPETAEVSTETATAAEATTEGILYLHMIDVGQGDCFLLVQEDNTALIDCGTSDSVDEVIKYLNELGITELDYVFGTHPHDDHMGGMQEVITNFEIGTIVIPTVKAKDATARYYKDLMQEIKSGEYEVHYAQLADEFELGEANMQVIGPINEANSNKNNYSICLKITIGEMDIIMTGDAEKTVEKDILGAGIDLDAEIFKAGHHGSDTSNHKEFLDAIDPDYVLISCGLGNTYKHPVESIINSFEEREIEVYRTDENGTVVAKITAHDVEFSCEPGDYLSGPELEERSSK